MAKKQRSDLEDFIKEAHIVKSLQNHEGWQILERDIRLYIEDANKAWVFLDKNNPKFDEFRVNVLACRKLLMMVEDYESNRLSAETEWLKKEMPELFISMDVDQETPLKEEE